jgi:hypothetical protein
VTSLTPEEADFRHAQKYHSPEVMARRELIHRFGAPDWGPHPDLSNHPAPLVHQLPNRPSVYELIPESPVRPSAQALIPESPVRPSVKESDMEESGTKEDEPPPLSIHRIKPSSNDSSSSVEDESED